LRVLLSLEEVRDLREFWKGTPKKILGTGKDFENGAATREKKIALAEF